jgi:hypothetical protein
MPSCNSRNNIIYETKRCLQILQREILPKNLKIISPSSSQPKKDSVAKDVVEKGKQKEEPQKKVPETRKETVIKEVEKTSSSFNFESEMAKIKILFHSMS